MSVVLIGGMDRLEPQYLQEAKRAGVRLRVFTVAQNNIAAKLKHADAVVIFTNKVSHRARNEAVTTARANDIPVFMHHTCGVCTLRECLKCMTTINHTGGRNDDRDQHQSGTNQRHE
jgi:uncharacterized protein YehS (DUF1456 family)